MQSGMLHRPQRVAIVTTRGSGDGRSVARACELSKALDRLGHRPTITEFSNLDDLRRWAARGGIPCSLLVCIGGDGTQSAAVLAALRQSVPLLAVPSGFGNLFANALHEPRRVEQVINLITGGTLIRVDVGQRNGAPFLCQESFGLLQQIQDRTEAKLVRPRARLLRSLAYYQTAVRQALRDAPLPRLTVTVDGRPVARDAVIVTVSNVPTYGGWLKLTPAASPIDGLFDVFIMRGRSKREILSKLLKRHLRLPAADAGTFVRCGRRVSVATAHGRADKLVVAPRSLTVVVSPQTAEALRRNRDTAVHAASARRVA